MDVRILGPLVVVGDGGRTTIGSPKQRALLEVLADAAGAVVSRDRLVDALWGVDPPRTAVRSLQAHVSRLRAALPEGSIETETGGYRLALAPEGVDGHRFTRLVGAGLQAHAASDERHAVSLLSRALELWRGEPFADLADGPVRQGARSRLEGLRDEAVAARIDAQLALGRTDAVVPELEALVAADPLAEHHCRQLMLARARTGDRTGALAACRSLRRALRDELGLDPTPETAALEAAVLADDLALLGGTAPPRTNLPMPLTRFVGRAREQRAVADLLDGHRLLTLCGPGGVGKSRLAIEVAAAQQDRWPDGVWWVDLARRDGASPMEATLVAELGIAVAPGLSTHDAVRLYLGPRRLLLVVDNAESLAPARGAPLVDLLQSAPGVAALVTTRVPLRAPGERRVEVGPMAVPPVPDAGAPAPGGRARSATAEGWGEATDAMTLFAERLAEQRAAQGDRCDDPGDIARLCRAVDGLPLGIELVAARTASVGAAAVLAQLRSAPDPTSPSAGGDHGANPTEPPSRDHGRHSSLATVIDSTMALLSEPARLLLERLSVFPADFDHTAAQAVGAELAWALAELIDASLISRDASRGDLRLRLLDTTRAHLRATRHPDDAADAERRHAEHYRDLVARAGEAMEGRDEGHWLPLLALEEANIAASLTWWRQHAPCGAAVFGRTLGRSFMVAGRTVEADALIEQLLAECARPDPADDAWLRLRRGWPRFLTGDIAGGERTVAAAVAAFEAIDEPRGSALALATAAHMRLLAHADTVDAMDLYSRAIEISRRAGDAGVTAWAQVEAAQALVLADLADGRVEQMLADAHAVFGAQDDHVGLAHLAMDRVFAAYAHDDLAALDAAAADGLAHARAAGHRAYEQVFRAAQGVSHLHRGDLRDAADHLDAAASIAVDTSNLLQLGVALQAMAVHASLDGRAEIAATLWGSGTSLAPLWPLYARRYAPLLAPAREALGDRFDARAAAGAELHPHAAVDLWRDGARPGDGASTPRLHSSAIDPEAEHA